MKFNKSDIPDKVKLIRIIEETAKSIFNSPQARRGRSFEKVCRCVSQGLVAEQYLIQCQGFEDDPGKYNDVKKDGVSWEIKAWTIASDTDAKINAHIKKFQRWRRDGLSGTPYNPSKLMIWAVKNSTYKIYKCFDIDSGKEITYE
jgi:hypothetical protein